MTTRTGLPPDPLAMARNLLGGITRLAETIDADPLAPPALGAQGMASAQMAGMLALVSIAEDLHIITRVLLKADRDLDDPPDQEGP